MSGNVGWPPANERSSGILLALGELPEPANTSWSEAAASARLMRVATARFDECLLHASATRPVCLVCTHRTSSAPEMARLVDPGDQVFRRIAVVVLSEGSDSARNVGRTAWDTLPASADAATVRAALDAALVAAQRRLESCDLSDDFYRRRSTLTGDEAEILNAVCDGKLNKQIASELNISIRTVEQRRRKVFSKMGVESAIPLARLVGSVETLERQLLRRDLPQPASTPILPPIVGFGGRPNATSPQSDNTSSN